jgi:hypothetical protein
MWPCVAELVVSDRQEEGVACISNGEVVHAVEFSRLENEDTMLRYILNTTTNATFQETQRTHMSNEKYVMISYKVS